MAPKDGQTVPSYRELQVRAKQLGLRANGSRAVLEQLLAGAEPSSGSAGPLIGATKTAASIRDSGGITLWPSGFAGIHKDGLFSVLPAWVDPSKPAGSSSIESELSLRSTLRGISRLAHFFMSPNLVWFAMAASVHYWAPYEMAKDAVSNAAWLKQRFALNFAVAFAYYGFFFAALYIFKLAKRKYRPNSYPTLGNMAHNMWYWTLGIVQWTFWEAVMVQLWATGVVAHKTNAEVLADRNLVIINALAIFLIPVWRDVHFYVAHRFLHIRAVYTYVHKLHHRNADPEPFSGITMHPVEHMYYYACAFIPSLYVAQLSPLIFVWNFVHLAISPGAGHSGWEDHFQADQYHFIHHAKFECNYGSPNSGCIDQYMGTFREGVWSTLFYCFVCSYSFVRPLLFLFAHFLLFALL